MNKFLTILGCAVIGCVLVALPAKARMDDAVYSIQTIGNGASSTNSATYVLRGTIEHIYIDVPSLSTGAVTVASEHETIFSKTGIAADACYTPRKAAQTYAGASHTWTELGTNSTGAVGMTITQNALDMEKYAVAGDVTVTVVGASTGTVTYGVTVVYSK